MGFVKIFIFFVDILLFFIKMVIKWENVVNSGSLWYGTVDWRIS